MRPDHRILRALFLGIASSWRLSEEGATLYPEEGSPLDFEEAKRVFGRAVSQEPDGQLKIKRPALDSVAGEVLDLILGDMGMYVERAIVQGPYLRVLTCVAKPEGLDWAEYVFWIEAAGVQSFYSENVANIDDWATQLR